MRRNVLGAFLALCLIGLVACSDEHGFELPAMFAAQSHDELVQFLVNRAVYVNPKEGEEYAQMLSDLLYPILTSQDGRLLEHYLEDFDFFVEFAREHLHGLTAENWASIRSGIEDYFFLNDFIFLTLIEFVIYSCLFQLC